VRSGHPWLFADSIHESTAPAAWRTGGALRPQRQILAVGLFDPDSPIRVAFCMRASRHDLMRLVGGAAAQALDRRRGLFDARTTGYRLIHGESDGWPGLVLDRYGTPRWC